MWRMGFSDLFVLAAAFTVFGLSAGLILAWSSPYLDDDLDSVLTGEPELNGSQRIVFTQDDLQEFSRVYRDADTEFAWCLSVRGNRVVGVDFFSELRSATEGNISFSCTTDVHNGAVHTHPSALATVELSDQDRSSLLGNDWMGVSCVVADPVEKGVSVDPRGIACYRDAGDQGVQRLQVEVRQ